MTLFDQAAVGQWLDRIYTDVPGLLAISYQDADARFHGAGGVFDNVDAAAAHIDHLERQRAHSIYARITTLTEHPPAGQRGGAELSHALPYLWADIDVEGPGHKHDPDRHDGRRLPPDGAAARDIVAASGLPTPSLWVASGGGFYPVWQLDPAHVITDDRDQVASLSALWQTAIQRAALTLGWEYGSGVRDLARVLRVPGTVNRKAGLERPCQLVQDAGVAYTLAELVALPALTPPTSTAPTATARTSRLTATRDPLGLSTGMSAFDTLDEHVTFDDLLTGAGWTLHRDRHGPAVDQCWTRPGDPEHACSAHTLTAQPNVLVVLSDAAGLPTGGGQRLTRGRLFAHLHHRGDERAAALDIFAALGGRPSSSAAVGLPLPRPPARVSPPVSLTRADLVTLEAPPPHDDRDAPPLHADRATDIVEPHRRIVLTPASTIKPRPVFWLWRGRIAIGTLSLLAGREGLGKSTLAYWVAARLTRGELDGEDVGRPRGVLVCATEDSWEHTIVPRLLAAGADLDRVYRVDVLSADDIHVGLSLPRDLDQLEIGARQADAALLLLDPLMSRLGENLDTHRDGDVRKALEPLVALADRTHMAVLGLMHHNKSGSSDPLQLVMASKAFTAVARSVHTVMPDPDDETDQRRLFGTPKNNLGRTDLPTLAFTVTSHAIDTDEGPAWTGRIEWGEELVDSIADTMRRAADTGEDRTAVAEAADWLKDYLTQHGGTAPSADIKKSGHRAGHTERALRGARTRLRLQVESTGFPRLTYWTHDPLRGLIPSRDASHDMGGRGEVTTVTTDTTGQNDPQSCQSGQSGHPPGTGVTTGPDTLDLDTKEAS